MSDADYMVSVVLPVHNAARHLSVDLAKLLEVLRSHYTNYEVIVVDDGSQDATATESERMLDQFPGLRVIRLAKHFGRDRAATAGLDCAIGDYVTVMDLRWDTPERIPQFVAQARAGCDVLLGVRQRHPFRSRWRCGFAKVVQWVLGCDPSLESTTFFMFSRPAANAISTLMQRKRSLAMVSSTVGFEKQFVPIESSGTRTHPTRSLREYLAKAVSTTVLDSSRPLRFVSGCGLFAAGLNVLYMIYILIVNLVKSTVMEGWTTLSLQMSGMFFLLFLLLAVLAEYIGKTLQESKGEPPYYVMSIKDSPNLIVQPKQLNVFDERAS